MGGLRKIYPGGGEHTGKIWKRDGILTGGSWEGEPLPRELFGQKRFRGVRWPWGRHLGKTVWCREKGQQRKPDLNLDPGSTLRRGDGWRPIAGERKILELMAGSL